MLYLGIERRILFLFSGVFYENRVLPHLMAMGWEGFISPNLAMGRWMSGHLQRMTWPPSGCDFMLTFKQSGSPLPHLHWWRPHCKQIFFCFVLFVFKFISWFSSPVWMAAQSPAIAASMKAVVGRSSRSRERERLFSTCTGFHQFKLAPCSGWSESSGHRRHLDNSLTRDP